MNHNWPWTGSSHDRQPENTLHLSRHQPLRQKIHAPWLYPDQYLFPVHGTRGDRNHKWRSYSPWPWHRLYCEVQVPKWIRRRLFLYRGRSRLSSCVWLVRRNEFIKKPSGKRAPKVWDYACHKFWQQIYLLDLRKVKFPRRLRLPKHREAQAASGI